MTIPFEEIGLGLSSLDYEIRRAVGSNSKFVTNRIISVVRKAIINHLMTGEYEYNESETSIAFSCTVIVPNTVETGNNSKNILENIKKYFTTDLCKCHDVGFGINPDSDNSIIDVIINLHINDIVTRCIDVSTWTEKG